MRWIVARASLREILGACLDVGPRAVAFAHGEKGKPGLATRAGDLDLQFSLAHSAELAVYAVTVGPTKGNPPRVMSSVSEYAVVQDVP